MATNGDRSVIVRYLVLFIMATNRHDLIYSHLHFCFASKSSSCRFMSVTLTETLEPGSHQAEMEVKKSKFLGYAQHVETWNEAQAFLQEVRTDHPKARHVCFGFVAGTNPVQERCSDDGEPTGTAGLPILG
jgi:hypothetical protein